MFVPLNVHSYYSLGWGCASLDSICQAAKECGFPALALTDTNNLYGLFFFIQSAQEWGLRPIVGAELTSRDDKERINLLVVNQQGYSNLCHLITARHLDSDFNLLNQLSERSSGLMVLTDNVGILDGLWKRWKASGYSESDAVSQLFVELVPHRACREALRWARNTGVKPVAVPRSFWIEPEDARLHRLLRAIHKNCSESDLKPEDYLTEARFLSEPEVCKIFTHCPEAVDNARRLAENCCWTPDFGVVYPKVEIPGGEDAPEYLRRLAYYGARWRYGLITRQIQDRLEHELDLIKRQGFAPVFLVIKDIVHQSSLTCGRGSAAASIVSYCLGITHVDPIRHNLFFERFINPAREDPPDIDVDFAWDERDDILDYVFQHYGEDNAAMVCNHVTFKRRMAIREVAKVFGLSDLEIGEVTKKLGYSFGLSHKPITEHPNLRGHGFAPPWPEILDLARRLEGIPRHLSVHCGGVVITPSVTADWAPTERAAKGVRILHWEKDQTEDSGLVKIDLLGNRSLAVIRDALTAIKEHYGIELDYKKLNPLDDLRTQELIAKGDTFGVFYVESPATRLLCKKAGRGDYEHLVIHSSIIRPAANRFINEYLRRLHGAAWEPLHPLIADILNENYGIMCYQEDVTRVAMALAGFDIAEADELRKILSKKHKKRRLEDLKLKFYEGAQARGASRETIDKIWDMILSFSGYSFCKPHSASYALVSFKSAYLRAHYPAEFIAAVLSNGGGFYSTLAYISEARRLGLQILPPDVNSSGVKYIGKDNWLRVGLQQIKGLAADAVKRVVQLREQNGLYESLNNVIQRAQLTPKEAKLLVLAGACDGLEPKRTRPEMIWQIALAYPEEQTIGSDKNQESLGQTSLSVMVSKGCSQKNLFDSPTIIPPSCPEYDERTLLRWELETLGFLISRHPLELYQEQIPYDRIVPAKDLDKHPGELVQMVGWMVTGKTVLTNARSGVEQAVDDEAETREQELMEFVTFEDTTGLIETVIFPQAFSRYGHLLNNVHPFYLWGKVQQEFGATTLEVRRLKPM